MNAAHDTHRSVRVQESISVDGQLVVMSLAVLEPDERERVAAAIASVAQAALDPRLNPAAWQAFIDDVLARHVTFDIRGDDADACGPLWWGDVIRLAAGALLRTNDLGPLIMKHVHAFHASSHARATVLN